MIYDSFIRTMVPVMFSKRLQIVQVTPKTIGVANSLTRHGKGKVFIDSITESALNKTKYFIGYDNNIPVAITGFNIVKWGYSSPQFTNTGSVTSRNYRRKGYMTELKLRIYKYIKQFGISHIRIQIAKSNKANISSAEKLGFIREKTYKGHVFMKLELNKAKKTGKISRVRKISLKVFVEKYNTYSQNFNSWTQITLRDYKERTTNPKFNEGNVIMCINTSTSDTMKYMLLAYYLIARSVENVSFIYIWSDSLHDAESIKFALDDMDNIFSSFMKQEYNINTRERLTRLYMNEMNLNRITPTKVSLKGISLNIAKSMAKVSLKEIYYTHVFDVSGNTKSIMSISLNIAKSVAKPGTTLISTNRSDEIITMPRHKPPNTHIDNNIKESLTNPPLVDTTAAYNKRVPKVRIREQLISMTTYGPISTTRKPIVIELNRNVEMPALNITVKGLLSLIGRHDVNRAKLTSYIKLVKEYYDDLGIGDIVKQPGSTKSDVWLRYLISHLKGDLKKELFEAVTDEYEFVWVDA